MATYSLSKSSLNVNRGGAFLSNPGGGGASVTQFTTASNEYAIVTITNFFSLGGQGGAMSITVGGTAVITLTQNAANDIILVRSNITGAATTNAAPGTAPFEIYVPPGSTFGTVIGASVVGSAIISGTYTVFQNT